MSGRAVWTRREALAALLAVAAGPTPAAAPPPDAWGLFAGAPEIARFRAAATGRDRAAAALWRAFDRRVERARRNPPRPLEVADVRTLRFGARREYKPDTLRGVIRRFERGGAAMRDLALRHVADGRGAHGRQAAAMLAEWAERHTLVDLRAFNPDYGAASFDGMTAGRGSRRPWPFALHALWQGYGLMNAADALLLLERAGQPIAPATRAAIRAWIMAGAAAVDSSLQAWTRWADANPRAQAYERYRNNNHLSWGMAGLIAAAAALDDRRLAAYVLNGDAWSPPGREPYANPVPITTMIDTAIEGGAAGTRGRIFEERFGRTPPIGYAMFHLEAMALVARIAWLRFGVDLWTHAGADGAGMLDAFRRYERFLSGRRPSPQADEDATRARWHFGLTPPGYGGADRPALLAPGWARPHQAHAVGPVALLFGGAVRARRGADRTRRRERP